MGSVRLAVIACALLNAGTLLAQEAHYASIVGNVVDSSGAVVPGAAVTVTNVATGVAIPLKTNNEGLYAALNLNPGTYRVEVTANGFKSFVRENMQLAGGQQARVDAKLEVGSVTEKIEVTAASPQINTENATTTAAPITFYQTVTLPNLAGTMFVDPYNQLLTGYADLNNAAFSVGGAVSKQNAEIQDGMRVSGQGGRGFVRPTVESVSELIVTTSNPSALYNEPAAIETVLKSGSNAYHGSLFYEHGNKAFNANNYFTHKKAPFILQQEGGSIGGPIQKNKTFFFFGYGGMYTSSVNPFMGTFPTAQMKTGDFSQLIDPVFLKQSNYSNPIVITDPLTGQPFSNNVIPANRISPIASKIAAVYPDPNFDNGTGFINNDLQGSRSLNKEYNFDVRVDHYFSPTQHLYGRLTYMNDPGARDTVYFPVSEGFWGNWFIVQGRALTLHYTSNVGSNLTNDVMFGYFRDHEPGGGGFFNSTTTAWNQKLGISGVSSQFDQGFPLLTFTQSGMTQPANFGPQNPVNVLYNIQDNVTWVRGRHSIRTGFEFLRNSNGSDIVWTHSFSCVYGCINFSGRWTGFDFADLMLGLPFSSSLQIPAPPDSTLRNQWGAYIQDDYKATPKLNVSFGLRYNYFPIVRSAHDYEAVFDPAKNQLVVPSQKALSEIPAGLTLPIPVVTASQAGYPSSLLQANKNDWQPRIGLAYRFMNNSVIRAGWGVYRTPLVSTGNRLVTGPYQITTTFPVAQPGPSGPPVLSLANPYQTAGAVQPPLLNFFAPEKDVKDLLHYDYNLTVEHQFRSTAFSAEYVAKKTILPWAPNLNAVPASLTPYSQSRLPFPALGSITGLANGAHYNYDALRLNASRRFTGGLYFDVTYIWSKTIDDLAGIAAETAGSSEDPFNRARDRGVSYFMPPTRMVINYVWEAPFGKLGGRLSFSHDTGAGRILNTVIKGWVTAGTYNLQSSPPLTPSGSYRNAAGQIYDAPNTNHLSGRPECTGQSFQPTSDQRAQGYVFNPNAFSGLVPQGQYGSCGKSILAFGPNSYSFNQSIFRTFKIPWFVGDEGAKFRFGFLMFNAINHSNGTSPVANLDSPLFGMLTNPKAGNTRSMYLQVRIDF